MGHAGLYPALHLRISAKAESISTLQQPSLLPTIDRIRSLWKAEGKSNINVP